MAIDLTRCSGWSRHWAARLVAMSALSGVSSACTYAPPKAMVRVENHVARRGTDSIAMAVVAATLSRPT